MGNKKEKISLDPEVGNHTGGRNMTAGGRRRKMEKLSKPGLKHSGAGKINGSKVGKKRIWYEGQPLWGPITKKGSLTMMSTIYQSNGSW